MLKLIIKKDNVKIDNYEIVSGLSNHTYYTIEYLLNKYENCTLCMVIGKDQLLNLANWYNVDFILKNTSILCFDRTITNGNDKNMINLYPNTQIVELNFPYSSSFIRKKIYKNETVSNLLISEKIKDYIYAHNLYI